MIERVFQKVAGAGGTLDGDAVGYKSVGGEKVRDFVGSRNRMRSYPLSKTERAALEHGGTPCWIYNVSPIFSWRRSYQGVGEVIIPAREKGKTLSTPIPIAAAYQLSYDKGENRRKSYVEYGQDVAESVVGNSKDYPMDLRVPTNNLENWGVFITYSRPFEELTAAEQEKLLHDAEVAHDVRCRELVLEGDRLHSSGKGGLVSESHRLAALHVDEKRPWVTSRSDKDNSPREECPYCTFSNKSAAVKCQNCGEVVNWVKYREIQARLKSAKVPEAEEAEG